MNHSIVHIHILGVASCRSATWSIWLNFLYEPHSSTVWIQPDLHLCVSYSDLKPWHSSTETQSNHCWATVRECTDLPLFCIDLGRAYFIFCDTNVQLLQQRTRPDWNSDHRSTLGNFLVYRNTQFSASHLLSPLWIGAHLDGEAEAHILRKVSLTYIHNEATPGCTSWGKLQGRVLGSVVASNSGRELIMYPITDWTAWDQSNKMRLSYLLFLLTSHINCVRFLPLSDCQQHCITVKRL